MENPTKFRIYAVFCFNLTQTTHYYSILWNLKLNFERNTVEDHNQTFCNKLADGYKPTNDIVLALIEKIAPVQNPRVIGFLCVAEHISSDVANEVSDYLTACIHHHMPTDKFRKLWENFDNEDDADNGFIETLGWYEELNGYYPYNCAELPWLYEKAVTDGADRFLWFSDNSFVYFVALHGDPGAKAIEDAIVEGSQNKSDNNHASVIVGAGNSEWPKELGIGSPIRSLGVACQPKSYGILRTGEKFQVQ